jgi:iron complex outermembrane receptor protein
MSAFIRFTALLLFAAELAAATISGTVVDSDGKAVPGANVEIVNVRVRTTSGGAFAFEVPPGNYRLRVGHRGFRSETRSVNAGEVVSIALQPAAEETITVSGIRAEAETPVTKTDIDRHEIERNYHGQDVPLLMRDVPSVVGYAESGVGGSGYSYISLRGLGPTRINFTLDGVPLADSEDMTTYFADFPDLAHSLQSIQVQRGAGTSTVGSPSFAGSVNLQSIDLSQSEQLHARIATGSFGHTFGTVGYQSGLLPGGFALYTRASWNESDGFRDSSGIRQRNVFVSAAKQNESSQIKITGFSGHEWQQLSFYATDAETLASDLRANPLQPEEKDSFGYDLAQVQYLKSLSDDVSLTASAYYQRGYGWYRLFGAGGLQQYGLDGMLLGSIVTLEQRLGPVRANYGLHVNRFRREHTRDLVDGPRDYFNYGTKGEANAFAKFSVDRGALHLYGDAQVRYANFRYSGDVDIAPVDWTFFNPRIGARYSLSPVASVYASAGHSTREPARNDMFYGEDNPSVAHDPRAVRPERVVDFESGFEIRSGRFNIATNLYAMEFRNEIASTGELSEIGLLLRRNVDRSSRRGIEVDATVDATSTLRFRTIANVSRNRISEWTQFYDVYDGEGGYVDSVPRAFRNVDPLLTPNLIINEAIEYTPSAKFAAGLVGRYVGRSYLDNTNNDAFVAPSFFTLDGNVSVSLGSPRLSLQVNNILNEKRIYPNGYDYLFMTRENGQDTLGGTAYYYPQATRNFVLMLDWRM